jgi:SAM-dependent methyltransferase
MTTGLKKPELTENGMLRIITRCVFNTMRILRRVNPGDTYIDNYLWHWEKQGDKFFDQYHLAWIWGALEQPKYILEIGTRTGISLCQLLSAIGPDYKDVHAVTFDLFDDGYISPKLVELNLKTLNIPTDLVEFVIGNSAHTVPKYLEEHPGELYDWVLVDGDHEKGAARLDLENVCEHVKPGGILVFDDVSLDGCDLLDVWHGFTQDHPEFEYELNMDGKGTE